MLNLIYFDEATITTENQHILCVCPHNSPLLFPLKYESSARFVAKHKKLKVIHTTSLYSCNLTSGYGLLLVLSTISAQLHKQIFFSFYRKMNNKWNYANVMVF